MREHHPGLDTSLGVACYAMVQERATYYNYDEMRKRIRTEYGLPAQATPFERERGMQIGAAGAFKTVANDEIAHHGIFLELVQIYLRYLPQDTLETLLTVFSGFTMPALALIPNGPALAEAMGRTRIHTPFTQVRQVNNPILDALGLENRRALERAVQQSKLLPAGLGPEHVALGRSGEFVVSMQPEPSAVTAPDRGRAALRVRWARPDRPRHTLTRPRSREIDEATAAGRTGRGGRAPAGEAHARRGCGRRGPARRYGRG